MKTLILYATKYGAAGEIAKRIANKIDGAVIHNLKQESPSLADFDCIIIGGSVYAGSIRKEVKTFIVNNENNILEKKFGLFLSGIGASGEKTYFDNNFSQKILEKAKTKSFLGGIFDPKKANFLERFIIKLVAKQTVYTNTIDDDKISQFVQLMK